MQILRVLQTLLYPRTLHAVANYPSTACTKAEVLQPESASEPPAGPAAAPRPEFLIQQVGVRPRNFHFYQVPG